MLNPGLEQRTVSAALLLLPTMGELLVQIVCGTVLS